MIVIEAPGKLNTLRKSLKSIGREDLRAFATGGHLFTNGDSLYPIGVDSNFRETRLTAVNPMTVDLLKEAAQEAGFVIIATDPDVEGNVIASDIERVTGVPCKRVHLSGLDPASLKDALSKAVDLDLREAEPGVSRRIMDRLIGGLYSNRELSMPVGRIQSAFLGLVSRSNPYVAEMQVSVPAADGGKDFIANLPLTADDIASGEALVERLELSAKSLQLPVIDKSSEILPPPPVADCGDMILHVAQTLDSTLSEVQAAMQRLYEMGALSYPRTDSRIMSDKAIQKMHEIATHNGIEIDPGLLSTEEGYGVQGAHDALHPLRIPQSLYANPKTLSFDEAVLVVIARRQLDAMRNQRVKVESPDLTNAPKSFQRLKWRREQGKKHWNGEKKKRNGVTKLPIDQILFKTLIDARLGRPGTQVGHIDKFIQRGYVNDLAQITERGKAVLDYTQVTLTELLTPETALGVEELLFDSESGKTVPQRVHAAFEFIRPGLSHEIRWMLQQQSAATGKAKAHQTTVKLDEDFEDIAQSKEAAMDMVNQTLSELKAGTK